MKEVMEALTKNSTWEIVDRPKDKRVDLERYKARSVAKGYTQTYGIDYEETFAPITKMNTVRVINSLAAHFGWNLQQFDVKNVFLHGELEEEVYMEIPPPKDSILTMRRTRYANSKKHYMDLNSLPEHGLEDLLKQSQGDCTLFIKHFPNGKLTLLLVYEIEKLNLKEKLATQVILVHHSIFHHLHLSKWSSHPQGSLEGT
ncbi:hypothetical protein CR513_27601, partial [Mucuna pruriens]